MRAWERGRAQRVWGRAACAVIVVWLIGCGAEPEGSGAAPLTEQSERAAPPSEQSPAPSEPALEPWSDAWLVAEAARYLDDPRFRRRALEASLTNPDNQYSRQRLVSYGLGDRGWDALPEWLPRTSAVSTAIVEQLRETGELALDLDAQPLWDGRRPNTWAEWVALGARVFEDYPLRPEVFARHALAHPQIAARVGLRPNEAERWPGVVVFEDMDRQVRVGITCALCHVGEDQDGRMVPGRARRTLDYGQMRLAYHRDSGTPIEAELAGRMARWGPGRADITGDEDEDPVAIPDLWGIRELRHLTQSATLVHESPAALAIRQETQLLHANHERARPPRELAWALAMYVYSLEPPAHTTTPEPEPAGAELFARNCKRCHAGPGGAGKPVLATTIGTDQALAGGRARGTGLYRPAPLTRVGDAAPYLHDGSLRSLEALFDPARLDPVYREGARGPGSVEGHRHGLDFEPAQRDALVAYLRTL